MVRTGPHSPEPRLMYLPALFLAVLCTCVPLVRPVFGQLESVDAGPPHYLWVSNGKVEGHLALNYSPDGAFSPDGSTLAVPNEEKIVLMNLAEAGVRKVLKPHLENINDLEIQSANFISPSRLAVFASGLVQVKGKSVQPHSPELAFQWNVEDDTLFDKVNAVGPGGGYAPPRFFPQPGYLGLYKEGSFDFWNPNSGRGGRVTIPDLTHRPNLYTLSPDGHWLLLAQVETSGTPDPVVVKLSERKFVDTLSGHGGTVLGIAFSRDSRRVATACEDGKVRVWSAPDWKLLATLQGHQGPVHWAEFSPDDDLVVSAGEDKTVRIWSAADGKLQQMLSESNEPLLTVAFSPDGKYVAASSQKTVLLWKRTNP
ncbi:MAG TPA: WD40 repeat domain-containing protein [Terriglobia bacterium]|nr:WD40 repeat domain-containing protein [Terriglobia bacterium]